MAGHPWAFRGTKAGQAPAAGTAVPSREHPSGPRLEVSRPKGPKTFKKNLLSEGLHILYSPGFPVSTWLLSIFRFQESKESCIKLFSLLQEMLQRAVRGRAEQKLGFRWGCSEKYGNNMVISNRYHGALTCHLCAVTISVLAFDEGVLADRHVELSMLST